MLVSFLISTNNIETQTHYCKNIECVHTLQTQAQHDTYVSRLRVWKDDDYSPLDSSNTTFLWPPFIDEQYQ